MAYDVNKLTKLASLKELAQRVERDYALKTELPAKVSDLTNDSNFQTDTQVAAAVASGVASADHLMRKKVASVADIDPAAEGADKYIYMVPKTDSDEDDLYDEYMVLDGKVEHVGNTKIDLSGYVQKEEGKGLSANDFTNDLKAKLEGIAAQATKVEAAAGSGTIHINGTAVTLFEVATDAEVAEMLNEVFGPEVTA